MGLRIQNNVEAFNAHRNLQSTANAAAKSMERLSSGFRINRAADDAAGLAISEKMRGQIGGVAQAQRNAQDGVSLVQTGEGALTEVHSMLQRIRELKVQFDNGTLNNADKSAIASEVAQLGGELSDIGSQTAFNGIKLLEGGAVNLQVGANSGETISISSGSALSAIVSGVATSATTSATFSGVSLSAIDTAIENVSTRRAELGAVQNRLEHRINNLSTYQENLTASESRIRDVDMAAEMVSFTKYQVLQQAGTAMLAQANSASQNVLSLLR